MHVSLFVLLYKTLSIRDCALLESGMNGIQSVVVALGRVMQSDSKQEEQKLKGGMTLGGGSLYGFSQPAYAILLQLVGQSPSSFFLSRST